VYKSDTPLMDHLEPPDGEALAGLAQSRGEQVTGWMREQRFDHLLLGSADNIRYASDFRSLIINETADHMLCLFDGDGQSALYGPHLKEEVKEPGQPRLKALRPLTGWTPLMAEPLTVICTIAEGLKQENARRVGYDSVSVMLLEGLRAELGADVDFEYVGNALFELRRVKLPAELDLMRLANADNLAALEAAFAGIKPGTRDRDILAAAVLAQEGGRAELITHSTCNVHSAPWNWAAQNHEITPPESIFLDQCFYGLGGYASDITRTLFIGDPPDVVVEGYRKLVEVSEEIHSMARTGARVSDLDDHMNRAFTQQGLAESPYGLGHGIGLRIMEPPSLSPAYLLDSSRALVRGEVLAIEPETSVEHDGVVFPLKVEDCFVVADDGLVPLGPTPTSVLPTIGLTT
jgi:Xaa-Pro aminopeptidase